MTTETISQSVGTMARGAAVNLVGSGFSIFSRLVFNLVVARVLGARQMGIYFLAITVASVMGMLALGGFDFTMVRYLARYRTEGDWGAFRGALHFAIRAVAALSIMGSLILLVGAPWIAGFLFHKPELATPLRIVALFGPFQAMESLLLASTQSFKQMKYKALIDSMLHPALRIVLVLGVYFMGGGLYAILASYIFALLTCVVLSWVALGRCIPVNLAAYAPRVARSELLRYCYPLFGVNIVTFMIPFADSLVLGRFRPAGEVGLYAVCLRIVIITGFTLPVVSQIFAPMISELYHRHDVQQLRTCFQVATLWAVELFIPLVLILAVASRQVLGLFGSEFRAASLFLFILLMGQLANVFTGPVGLVLNMVGWTRLQFWNSAVTLAVQVTLAFLLIPRLGILGAALANATAVLGVNMARVVQLEHRLRIHPFSANLAKPVGAALLALLATLPFGRPALVTSAPRLVFVALVMLLTYGGTLMVLGLDHHSRLAWTQLRASFGRRFLRQPIGLSLGKETE